MTYGYTPIERGAYTSAHRNSLATSKPCAYCGTPFTPKSCTASFCSTPCGNAFRAFDRRQETADIRAGIVNPGGYGASPRPWKAFLDGKTRRMAS